MPTAELNPLAPVEPTGPADRDARARGSATDATLVRRMRGGDERAFETIFKRHHAPLLSYCRHMLASLDEAEDALQQTFIRAHRALLGESPPRELRPWLYAIARNCCLSTIAARRSTDELDERTPSLGGLSEAVHEREELRELVTDIARLPEDQRSALLLSELDDLSHRAIAGVVGCPVSKVKALVYQARTTLMAERAARSASCRDIREELAVARGGGLRRGPLRRHLRLCSGCRDFQLAVEAQRQSLAIVLPVLPSAALAARILGHGALHAVAGAAGVGQASASMAPAAGGTSAVSGTGAATGTSATVGTSAAASTSAITGTGAAAGGGTGVVAAGGAAAGTTATAGTAVVSGTSAGAWIGGGLVAKVAVGGAVAALATVGAVAIPHRLWHVSRRTVHGALHSGARSTSAVAAGGRVASNTVFASATGLSQASPAALQGPSPAGSLELGLSGLVSPAAGLEAAATRVLPPGSGSTSPPPGAGNVTAPASGTVATIAGRRAKARRARLRALRNRRRLLERRQRLLKRRLLRKQRRLLKQRKHRKLPAVKPAPVAPTVAAPAPKPTHHKKKTPRAASSPTPSTAPTTTADQTPTKHRKTRTPERGAATGASPTSTSTTPTSAGTPPTSTGTAPTATGTPPTSTGTTPTSRKTGKGSTTGGASTSGTSGTATGESSGSGTSPAGDKETASGTGSGKGKRHKPSATAGGESASSDPLAENTLDANQPSDQPLG